MKRFVLVVLLVGAVGIVFWWASPEPTPAPSNSTSSTLRLADLTITSATVQRVADPDSCEGVAVCLIVTVTNQGSVDASGLQDGCSTSSFGDPEPGASFTQGGMVPAGASVTFRSGYPVIEPYLPATFMLVCEVDAAGRIDESDETNNRYSATISL